MSDHSNSSAAAPTTVSTTESDAVAKSIFVLIALGAAAFCGIVIVFVLWGTP